MRRTWSRSRATAAMALATAKTPQVEAQARKVLALTAELRREKAILRRMTRGERKRVSRGVSPGLAAWRKDRDECDKLMSRIVRFQVGHCEACGSERRSSLQWAHGLSRKYSAIRYDFENSFALCAGCHKKFTHDPIAWADWMRAKIGDDAYRALVMRSLLKRRHDPTLVIGLRARASSLGILDDDSWRLWMDGA